MSDVVKLFDAFDLPPEKAIALLKSLGIDVTKTSFEEMMADATERSFVLAKVAQADILEDMRRELVRAMDEGLPFEEFKKSVRLKLERRGWGSGEEITKSEEQDSLMKPWRLEVIYRQNLQASMMAGRYLGQLEVADRRPYLMYDAIRDNRTTDLCSGLDGIVRRIDDAFWTIYYPPNHMLCRARATSMSQRELERLGLSVATDERTENIEAPAKGFDRSPNERFQPDFKKYSDGIKKQLRKALE